MVFLNHHSVAQIFVLLVVSVIFQILMIIGNPMTEKWDKRITFIIEATISIYLYVLLSLTNFMGENTLREELGWILTLLIGIIVALNVSIFIWKCFIKAVAYIKVKIGHLLIKKASKSQIEDSENQNQASTA
jgi:Na+/melibiose symporter-like transporter